MDLEVVLLIAAAVVGIVVGLLHLVGYVPPRYRRMLREVQSTTAKAIGDVIDARLAILTEDSGNTFEESLRGLPGILQELPIKIGDEVKRGLVEAQTEFAAEMSKQLPEALTQGIPPNVTGALGGDLASANRLAKQLKAAVGQSVLGPYGALLEQFAPPLYDFLQEHPEMAEAALNMPIVQKAINFGQRAMGQMRSQINESGGLSGEEARRAWEK